MSAIKSIRTRNIQSHKDVLIELPETGLVVFWGENSNGKSVIRKVLEDVISGGIKQPKVRRSIINKKVNEGSIEIRKYDGTVLLANINLEASRTYVKLIRVNGDEVIRYLADKNYLELVYEFGFHYDSDCNISLNICDSDDSLLFFRTKHAVNGSVLNTSLTDTSAQSKAEALRDSYREAISMRQTFKDNLRVAMAAKSEIRLYNIEEEQSIKDRALQCANILEHIYIPKLIEAEPIPLVTSVNVLPVRVSTFKVPLVVSLPTVSLKDVTPIWKELKTTLEGRCPTCGRPFFAHQTSTSEM